MSRTRVKICCISSPEEAQLAIAYGADALGLVGPMPSGPGIIDDALIRQITKTVPPPIATFLLTSETDAQAIILHHRNVQTTTIQIVDELKSGMYTDLRQALPAVKLVQVVHVENESALDYSLQIEKHIDAILLDSGKPASGILGGTGNTHNWSISRQIVEQVKVPVFLAGGLQAENARRAIEEVKPFGLDLCSGVRTNGQLDPGKLEAFFKQVYA